ncbi:putative ilp is an apoptosis inhibitor protein [Rosellinia necatrix]|uniref:Putative ilp is an apoptosis inhibitor protein n=1 Tax=Rosellinia necatrix TaxID=77044 RepID=A0A1W2TLE8_ROSNE|nr:putative ilp is an apoptosis inhibitor protein [Rosellinia necatrix]
MSFPPGIGRSVSHQSIPAFHIDRNPPTPFCHMQDPQFDVLQWYPHFQSCVRYFLDHAQHENSVQAMAAFINIKLPFQKSQYPIISSRPSGSQPTVPSPSSSAQGKFSIPGQIPPAISLTPYIRRLVATGFDFPGILHGFFGDDWALGISHLHESERRNYLFAAKASSWLDVKSQYDMPDEQTIPFLQPLQRATESEIISAEGNWSEWLAMQDWMIGPRNPEELSPIVKVEDA